MIRRIGQQKQKNVWSFQVINELLFRASLYVYEDDGSEPQAINDFALDTDRAKGETRAAYSLDENSKLIVLENDNQPGDKGLKDSKKKRTASVLIAAKKGVIEMVEKIVKLFPVAIEEKKNVVLLAVEHRQHQFGCTGNTRNIPGADVQMQWEIKWLEFVKESMPSHLFAKRNNHNETPDHIFKETHAQLVKSGGEWLHKTSEACSAVAVGIATVAFARSATLLGGVDQNTGRPTLEGEPAFNVFAISSLIALFCSVTAVVMFLSIFTSRYQEYDFRVDLPMKLIVGLTSLFMSIASMLVSFCAGDFFVLRDQLRHFALPIYAAEIGLAATVFAFSKFPHFSDLAGAALKVCHSVATSPQGHPRQIQRRGFCPA
ncbi:uncharacterized protein LOC114720638 [Neltuma alba]|uniref:uncharacterized protein LOC114720638 n=1 Tax=Neltuma alba TaxID=207710 RepID=UPI0010A305CB|nr:uncharacterized protein LOC114720638 [Prosopis alba]